MGGANVAYTYQRRYRGKIQAVLLDWAGTTMDHGCMAPAVVFVEVYRRQHVPITMEEAPVVCASDVPAGRPAPFTCLLNVINLQVSPVEACVKVDDTVPGIEEGLNAGMWTVGLAMSGNEIGLSLEELEALAPADREARRQRAYTRMWQCGAHYVVDTIEIG